MGKISEILLKSLFISSAYANSFAVPSCNDNTPERRPEMTIEIAEDWFDNNISGQEGFTLDSENEVYRKTISEADLTFEFSTDTDDIILSHTVPVTSNGFAIDDTTSISFAEENVVFQCRYARAIEVDESMIIDPDTQPEVGRGDLTYRMAITAGELGGTTRVQITPNHSFGDEVGARVVSCNVSHAEHDIYAFHSWNNGAVCRDHTRLKVLQTEFGQNISFEMRTFRFITAGSSASEAQDQTLACNLHLEPLDDVSSTQPDDCTCHTEDDCIARSASRNGNAVLVLNTERPSNMPFIVDFDGNINEELDFEYGAGTAVTDGCGAYLHNEFWYFGGNAGGNTAATRDLRQASKIVGCKLERQHDLNFDYYQGSCNTFNQPDQKVLLCFDKFTNRQCYAFDGESYQSAGPSEYRHRYTLGLANYREKALTTGCHDHSYGCGLKTELMDMNTLTWSPGPDYPFTSDGISAYSTVSTSEAAYIIGGHTTPDIIAEFKEESWRQVGTLAKGRSRHETLLVGDEIMVIGGWSSDRSDKETEIWSLTSETSNFVNPTVENAEIFSGIILHMVPFNFCTT